MRQQLLNSRPFFWLRLCAVLSSVGLASSCVPRKSASPSESAVSGAEPVAPSLEVDPNLPVVQDGPWLDTTLSSNERAKLLVRELSENEKLKLIFGYYAAPAGWKNYNPPEEARHASAGYVPGIPRLGIPPQWQTDAGMGVASQIEGGPPRERTALPSTLAVTASWNPSLARETGAMIGAEARASGFNVMLAGSVNLLRTGYGGRNFEYGGEDPYLAGSIVGEQIAGVQSNNIICTIKHFAVNGQETDRLKGNSILADEAARTSDLLAFEIAIERGNPGAVMCAYNRVNGHHACESEYLLQKVLRDDWQYPGYVLSDWGGVHSTEKAAHAGLEQQSGWPLDSEKFFQGPLKLGLASGSVSQKRLDEMVTRILRSMFEHGLFEHPVAENQPIAREQNEAVSLRAAEEGAVLLKNDNALLPLTGKERVVAVIGGYADKGVLSGGGSSQVYPEGGNAVPGLDPSSWPGPVVYYPSSPARELKRALPKTRVQFDSGKDAESAARLAKQADVAIVFATHWSTESIDTTLSLPNEQDALIEAVAKANPKTVVVLQSGTPNLMPWAKQVPAILQAWFPGTSGGRAIAHLLSGKVNPSGHLPLTIPRTRSQLAQPDKPSAGDVKYTEGATIGYKWFDKKAHEPLFEFGHGLSFTSFSFGQLSVEATGQRLVASFLVKNTGERRGKDVAQIYIARDGWEAPRRLGAFQKFDLAPGEERSLSLVIDPRLFSVWSSEKGMWIIEEGPIEVLLASSSRQIEERQMAQLGAATIPASGPVLPQEKEPSPEEENSKSDAQKPMAARPAPLRSDLED